MTVNYVIVNRALRPCRQGCLESIKKVGPSPGGVKDRLSLKRTALGQRYRSSGLRDPERGKNLIMYPASYRVRRSIADEYVSERLVVTSAHPAWARSQDGRGGVLSTTPIYSSLLIRLVKGS